MIKRIFDIWNERLILFHSYFFSLFQTLRILFKNAFCNLLRSLSHKIDGIDCGSTFVKIDSIIQLFFTSTRYVKYVSNYSTPLAQSHTMRPAALQCRRRPRVLVSAACGGYGC